MVSSPLLRTWTFPCESGEPSPQWMEARKSRARVTGPLKSATNPRKGRSATAWNASPVAVRPWGDGVGVGVGVVVGVGVGEGVVEAAVTVTLVVTTLSVDICDIGTAIMTVTL